jgi:sarcosine oxidase subunit alpha
VARGEHAWPSVERDLLAGVGRLSRWIPPTFYHHRFLRPRRLRKRYLDVLRWFGGRGRLRTDGRAASGPGRPTIRLDTDVLVVGAGRAGRDAAGLAAEAGSRVVLVDDRRAVRALPGVRVLAGVTAVGWYDGVVAALGDDGAYEITAGRVVVATGSYDRVPLVPGADLPGVMAARTVLGLLDRDGRGVAPGRSALLVGSGQELATAGERLARAGVTTQGPIRTPALVAVHGRDRVSAASIDINGTKSRPSIDLVVFGDRSPNLDLALAAGAAVERVGDTLVPVLDLDGRTTVPNLSIVGSATGRHETRPETDHTKHAAAHDAAMVCFCEDVRAREVRNEIAAGYTDAELLKRRTGTLTGPCQGKQCLQAFACVTGTDTVPTARPPLRPVRLGDLVPPAAE